MFGSNLFKRYKNDKDGSISSMFAVSFTASIIVIGAAFDLALIYKSQAKLQSVADAAALAAIQYDGTIDEKKAMFTDYINSASKFSNGKTTVETTDIEIEITDSLITLEATVALPHDMMMLKRFGDFGTVGASTKSNMGIENIEIALVLDISSSMSGNRIKEAKESASFFVDHLLEDGRLMDQVAISLVPFGGTVRVPKELETLLIKPDEGMASYSKNWIDNKWNQCFELDNVDLREGINYDSSLRVTPDYWSWNWRNPWCPREGNELIPLTDDAETLKKKIDGLTLSDGTGSDHGMAWGFEALNNEWENKFPGGLKDTPAKNDSATKKILIFMTDGGITGQHHVRDQDRVGSVPYNSKRKTRVTWGDSKASFYAACDNAKAKDIEVYTIGYTIKNDKQLAPLIDCATSSQHYLNPQTGNLGNVFSNIADEISPLRISN